MFPEDSYRVKGERYLVSCKEWFRVRGGGVLYETVLPTEGFRC